MSIHASLKTQGNLAVNRNVLTRAERVAKLVDKGKLDPNTDAAIGLPKTSVKGDIPKITFKVDSESGE
ncbi:MAG: small basic protein [Phycisphaerales bacterium JB038]